MPEPATNPETRIDSSQPATRQDITEERIRIRAYELFEKRNGAAGDPESDWYHAEAEIRSEAVVPASSPSRT